MLVAQNSLGPVCPVPLTVRGTSFNQPLNKWNVSNDVTYMEEMFEEATSFNQPLHAPWYAVEQSDSVVLVTWSSAAPRRRGGPGHGQSDQGGEHKGRLNP